MDSGRKAVDSRVVRIYPGVSVWAGIWEAVPENPVARRKMGISFHPAKGWSGSRGVNLEPGARGSG